MKPLKLQFKGINSFSESTVIDFESLTRNGIFGIFGDTGSGKSTILDCINFALYGSVERSKEKLDIINYRSESAEVKFSFDISVDGRRRTYTVERSIRKNKYGTHRAMLFEREGLDEVCIADNASSVQKKIVEILGVEEEDFRKCIALPQGEFSQFVKSRPSDRLALIERLFALSKYGDRLKDKINAKQSETENEFQNIKGRLFGLEDVSEDAIKIVEENIKNGNVKLEILRKSAKSAAEKYEGVKNLNEKRKQLNQIRCEIKKYQSQKSEMDELRAGLKALPTCREVVLSAKEKQRKQDSLKILERDISENIKNLKLTEEKLRSLENNERESNFDEREKECTSLAAKYSLVEGKPEKLKEIMRELQSKREDFRIAEEEKNKLTLFKATVEADVYSAEQKLKCFSEKNLENFVNINFKGAVLRGEYESQYNYFSELYSGVKLFADDTELYKYISSEISKKVFDYRERIESVKDFKLDNASKQLKDLQKATEEREEAINNLNTKKRNLSETEAAIKLKEKELETLKRDGTELRKRADEITEELTKAFGSCTDFSAAIAENERKLRLLVESRQKLSLAISEEKNRIAELKIAIEGKNTSKQHIESELSAISLKLNQLVLESGLTGEAQCIALASSFVNYPDAEKSLNDYDNRVSALTAKLEELLNVKDIENISNEMVAAAEADKTRLDGEVISLNGEIAVCKANCEILKSKLKEKNLVLKDFKRIEQKKTLIERLKEAVKNNKFLEYIADEYLFDISSLASSTLLKLTDGRYFLTYKDNNFYVGDNFDCGNLRGVNTLSGGETFLVSLSLALALSQTICSKSMKSIEFFFLDEGFGTLDSTLVDTVMNALEKLKSSSFTIGVISHVEELKHRIDSKITVIKATENCGSKVQLSC